MRLGDALYDLLGKELVPKQLALRVGEVVLPLETLCRSDWEFVLIDDSSGERKVVKAMEVSDEDIIDGKKIHDKLQASMIAIVGGRGISDDGAEAVRRALPELISLIRSQRMAEEIDQNGHKILVEETKNG